MSATWSLITTMSGGGETVLPRIAHHLNSDAEFLHIYLDSPSPEGEMLLQQQPLCVVTNCADAYWSAREVIRPDLVYQRQMENTQNARSSSDWLAHHDSDEFLENTTSEEFLSFSEDLAVAPPSHDWVQFLQIDHILPEQNGIKL